jgi:MFS family permease
MRCREGADAAVAPVTFARERFLLRTAPRRFVVEPGPAPMLRSPLLPIFLTVFVDVLGLTLMLPLLPFYTEHFGGSPLTVGLLIASYGFCQLISGPILGRISDRVGRKPVLLVSQAGTFFGFLTIGFASTLWMLFLGRILDGLTAGNLSIAQAYISDVTRPENRTRAFALIGIAFGSGFLIGPAISGILAHRFGYATPAFAAAGLSLLSIVLTATLLPKNPIRPDEDGVPAASAQPVAVSGAPRPAPPPAGSRSLAFGKFFSRPLPRRRLLEFFAFTLSFSTLIGGLALFLNRRFGFNVENVGWVYAFSGLIGGFIQGGIIGRLVKRYGEAKLALSGFVTMAIGYCFLGLAHGIPVLLVLVAISGFGVAVTRPALTTLLTKSVGREEQGAALGVSQSLSSIAQIVGAPVAGLLIEHGWLWQYGVAAGSVALVGVVIGMQPEPVATSA